MTIIKTLKTSIVTLIKEVTHADAKQIPQVATRPVETPRDNDAFHRLALESCFHK